MSSPNSLKTMPTQLKTFYQPPENTLFDDLYQVFEDNWGDEELKKRLLQLLPLKNGLSECEVLIREELGNLLAWEIRPDLKLTLTDETNHKITTEFKVHKDILSLRVEYFQVLFSHEFLESTTSDISLSPKIFTVDALRLILQYIYTGQFKRGPRVKTLMEVWTGADYLGLQSLCDYCLLRIEQNCHYLRCDCKQCKMMLPRVLEFAYCKHIDSLKDIVTSTMIVLQRNLWLSKSFAQLEPEIRGYVLQESIQATNSSNVFRTLKTCYEALDEMIVKGRSNPWMDILEETMEELRDASIRLLVSKFEWVCMNDRDFIQAIDGVGWNSDFLEKVMNSLILNLKDEYVIPIFRQLDRSLLQREAVVHAGKNSPITRLLIDAHAGCLEYIKRRWMGIRLSGGFNCVDEEFLSLIALELNMEVQDFREDSLFSLVKKRTSNPQQSNTMSRQLLTSLIVGPIPSAIFDQEELEQSKPIVSVGDRVLIATSQRYGQVAYIGRTEFGSGEWIGVELDNADGRHDGTVNGVQYFSTENQRGVFVRRDSLQLL
ncbi:hypothetical protein K7432_008887 [Basidiobolus ranarum]|uniref:Uncharacterized protein n=1 Tax=Basidiobolus ranarum TaxID=34480 RepID=A0ABR2WR60_9FUNG